MNTHNTPLTPPKRILDRLTPLSTPRTKKQSVPNTPRGRKVLSPSEVHEKVRRWKERREEMRRGKREEMCRRMDQARMKRETVLEERRETARRFSQESKIWTRFKVKCEVLDVECSVFEEDAEELDTVVVSVERLLLKRKLQRSVWAKPLDELVSISWDECQTLVQKETKLLDEVLRHYSLPRAYTHLPLSRTFLFALLILVDHNSGGEVFDSRLGTNAEAEFGGFAPRWMKTLRVFDDGFVQFSMSQFLICCRTLILSFQRVVLLGGALHDVKRLKLLKCWREYNDLFRVIQVLYLSRCLLLLLKAIDVLKSGIAVEEFIGVVPEYEKLELFMRRKRVLEGQLGRWLQASKPTDVNLWCTLGISLSKRLVQLSQLYEKAKSSATEVTDHGLWIPPGFSLEEWEKYRLFKEMELREMQLHGTVKHMKTGREVLVDDPSDLEFVMEQIGMKTFRQECEECVSVDQSVALTVRLLGSFGVVVEGEDLRYISEGFKEEDESTYFHRVQQIVHRRTRLQATSCPSLPEYLKWWKPTMVRSVVRYVQRSLSTPFTEFSRQLTVYRLRQSYRIRDLDELLEESALKLYGGPGYGARFPFKTLVVQELLERLQDETVPVLFTGLASELVPLYKELIGHGEAYLFLVSVGGAEQLQAVQRQLPSHAHQYWKWHMLLRIHWETFGPDYEKLALCL